MAEYIEREAAYDTLTEYYHHRTDTQNRMLREALSRVPAADVRPVVLCLHCVNWETSWAPNCGKEYGHFCPMVGTVTRADWFCADGEKREES